MNGVQEEKAMQSVKSVENECFKRTSFSKEKFKVQIRKLNKNAFLGRMELTPQLKRERNTLIFYKTVKKILNSLMFHIMQYVP